MNERMNTSCGQGVFCLPAVLLSDLQLDRILGAQTLGILQKPCDGETRRARLEIFAALEDPTCHLCAERCLSALTQLQRTWELWREAKIPLDKYHLEAVLMDACLNAFEALDALSHCDPRLALSASAFGAGEWQGLLTRMREDHHRLTVLLERMHIGLLSMADKLWLTPDREAVSEREQIAACAREMGLVPPSAQKRSIRVDMTLSDAVCRLYADEVSQIETICDSYAGVAWGEMIACIPELRFYLDICGLLRRAEARGIPHCIPSEAASPQYTARELYDISLLAKECERIVPNDVSFTEQEPFAFLIGANGGGKTTYLRAVGLNLVLFLAGCPVFAREAVMYPFARIYSHFPRDERFDRTGRLDEEQERVARMLADAAGHETFLLFNETFSGTDDVRGFDLLRDAVKKAGEAGHFGLFVTHFHEVMTLDVPVLSAQVDSEDKNKRTYRIHKTKGTASSFAADILRKYRLDRESLRGRRGNDGN